MTGTQYSDRYGSSSSSSSSSSNNNNNNTSNILLFLLPILSVRRQHTADCVALPLTTAMCVFHLSHNVTAASAVCSVTDVSVALSSNSHPPSQ